MRCPVWIVGFVLLIAACEARAAEIKLVSAVSLGSDQPVFTDTCSFSLEGEITEGDAARLSEVLSRFGTEVGGGGILCLNSTGGSYPEAIKIVELLRTIPAGTYVRDGAECYSACSLVFLGGRIDAHEVGPLMFRFLHVNGKLGFHSPSLSFPEGIYTRTIVDSAYRSALKSIAMAFDQLVLQNDAQGLAWMKPSLISLMLATPPETMAYIETVDQVGRWGISIVPVIARPLADLDLRKGCANALAWRSDQSAITAREVITETSLLEKNPSFYGGSSTFKVTDHGMASIGCILEQIQSDSFIIVPFVNNAGETIIHASAYHFLPPETKLSEIASKLSKTASNLPALSRPTYRGGGSRCTIHGSDTRILDDQRCTLQKLPPTRADILSVEEYLWPEGTRTIVTEMKGGRWLINGVRAIRHMKKSEAGMEICYVNRTTNNTFCYLP